MWVLIHTHPKSSAADIRIARPKSLVQTEEARPYSTPFAHATACASSSNCWTVITGPKISCCIRLVVLTETREHRGLEEEAVAEGRRRRLPPAATRA